MSEKWLKLARLLISNTNAGKLEWSETSDESTYQTIIGQSVVELEKVDYLDQFIFRLYDATGELSEQFTDDDIYSATGEREFAALMKLFSDIERKISGRDVVLDGIIDKLSRL